MSVNEAGEQQSVGLERLSPYSNSGIPLPPSCPAPPPEIGTRPKPAETREEREIAQSHDVLDELGVPWTKELTPEETAGGVYATHVLRLHGRLREVQQALRKRGIELFPKNPEKK